MSLLLLLTVLLTLVDNGGSESDKEVCYVHHFGVCAMAESVKSRTMLACHCICSWYEWCRLCPVDPRCSCVCTHGKTLGVHSSSCADGRNAFPSNVQVQRRYSPTTWRSRCATAPNGCAWACTHAGLLPK
ncbi:hypothetical protein C8Q72DRAFT_656658 [Fomitopsis betulina]|nr:hypothetical protein C8Q72DRAFT_656658 [Fomitopsis betulina]